MKAQMFRLPIFLALGLTAGCTSAALHGQDAPPRPPRLGAGSTGGVIEVDVTGIPTVQGQLFVEVYDERTYFHYDRVLAERIVPVVQRSMKVLLTDVPPGRYIVAVSHDENSNRELDTSLFGAPTEAYGFSRDARGTFGPPDFVEGAFDFDGTRLEVPVAIR
ncbi:MAG: DUF2141 domain-containing protein [Deltaproteobacteria bacterium]|nr:DUF2141 domain-containing protein [Deltaproteobacteria bacterium]